MGKGRTRQRQGVLKTSLHPDQSGMAFLYFPLLLTIIAGLALLQVDPSRVRIIAPSLKNGADAVALAMAVELDNTSIAITRSVRAKGNLVSNPANLTDSFAAVDGTQHRDRRRPQGNMAQ